MCGQSMNYTLDNPTAKLQSKNAAARVVLLYAVFACLWILSSDWILVWLVSDPTRIAFWSTVQGWLFVVVTSLLLFGMIQRQLGQTFSLSERESEAQTLLNQQAQRSEALLNLPLAADAMNETDFLQHGLAITEQLTGSQIGFVHCVHDDQETIDLLTWSQSTLTGYCTASVDRHYPISQAGIWADALRQRKPVLINDYANASGKHGLPEGHARLERLISVPVIEDGLVRMMMGVGNKPLPYTDMDVETARLVAQTLYRIFSKRRSDQAMHQSQESLKEAQRIASIGSYALDMATGRWESSEELDRLFGLSASFDRSVQSWESLIHPEDRAMMSEYFRNQVAGQHRMFDKEYRIVKPDDEAERWVHGLGRLEFDSQGDLQKMVGTV